ncbi:MAG TPA: alkyl hydroperoxide reductase [Rhodospirillaceae bacterium]|jgi:alkyl hydroperoxide reductase subunit AhpC|nr:peroxiredoxin [Alphaproteobacteria bacterium]HBH26428.1 alkyl hydroperoxide reductase [Rhodospirillaceae bacterium]
MLCIGDQLPEFCVTGVKPGFMRHEENGESAFEEITRNSFPGKWKVIVFYPKDFTFVCPTEITGYAGLESKFAARGAVVMCGSTDNEFCKLAWRREHPDLHKLNQWSFADTNGSLVDGLGVRDLDAGVALRATVIADPEGVIQHISVNGLNVGRNPEETLRILDALQSGQLCGCNRKPGGETIDASAEAKKIAA